jgi:hypothetical protein
LGDEVGERAVIDRLHRLRIILPAMAQELAEARRAAARLRRENAELASRLSHLDGAGIVASRQNDDAARSR